MDHIVEGGMNPSLSPDSWQGELMAFDQVIVVELTFNLY